MSSRIEITVTYNLPEDEFRALPDSFPTATHHRSNDKDPADITEWYRVDIDSPNGVIKLTWFLE